VIDAVTVTPVHGGDDLTVAASILDERARWLWDQGIRQWGETYPERFLRAAVEAGALHLARDGGVPFGTIGLHWTDPVVWGHQPPNAGYIHQLAIATAYAGDGRGQQLLDWAAARIRAAGRTYLRLDCVAVNTKLCAYYRTLGFTHVGDVPATPTTRVRRWQLPV
jgi:ribosomal protein S18 acetylase RimI-like enzyme